jgi:hypothetical protein
MPRRLSVSINTKKRLATIPVSITPLVPGNPGRINGLSYHTKALIDTGSTSTVLGAKAWRKFRLGTPHAGAPLANTLKLEHTTVGTGKRMPIRMMPVRMRVGHKPPFKTTVALHTNTELDVFGFSDIALSDLQLT